MSNGESRTLLSIGIFLVIIVVSILLYQPLQIIDWTLSLPLIIALSGCWLVALAGIRVSSPRKYERGPFSTAGWGLLLVAVGGAWFLYGYGWYYSLALVLLASAGLAIAAALKRK